MNDQKSPRRIFSVTGIILATFVLLFSLYSQNSGNGSLSADDLQRMIQTGSPTYLLVDVRTPGEYRDGYIPSAVNIPLQQIAESPPGVDKESLVIVYCRSGNRSAQTAGLLKEMGYTNIVDFGGINRWPYDKAYP